MKIVVGLALAAGVALAAPAYSTSLVDGYGTSAFQYGTLSGGGFVDYTAYTAGDSHCLGLGACYTGSDTYAIVADPENYGLLIHPGPGTGGNSAIKITAGNAGLYKIDTIATSYDTGTKTVGYFTIVNNVLTTFGAGNISGANPGTSLPVIKTVSLGAGDSLGFFVDNYNGYSNDSTRVSGSIGAVPEPASWAMMLGGFGLVGASLRRRRATARFA